MIIHDRLIFDTSNRRFTSEGYLIVDATLSRTGIQDYYGAEIGIQDRAEQRLKVYRSPEEVFKQSALDSLEYAPVTIGHPPESVSAKNSAKYSVGMVHKNIQQADDTVTATLRIIDQSAIDKITSGTVELSVGYSADIVPGEGKTPQGLTFDAIQTNILANHVAIVDQGRCGATCKISDQKKEEPTMATLKINDIDIELPDQALQAVTALQKKLADAESDLEKKKKEEEEEEENKNKMKKDHLAELDSLQAKLDDALSRAPTPEQLDALVQSRMATVDAARAIDSTVVIDSMDCEQIRKSVVAAKCSDVKIDDVSADYIRARFDALAASSPITDALVSAASQTVDDAPDSAKARAEFIKKTTAAWRSQ